MVVRGSAWLAASWTSRSGTPASRAVVMKAWRRVWPDWLPDASLAGKTAHDPPGGVTVEPFAVVSQEDATRSPGGAGEHGPPATARAVPPVRRSGRNPPPWTGDEPRLLERGRALRDRGRSTRCRPDGRRRGGRDARHTRRRTGAGQRHRRHGSGL